MFGIGMGELIIILIIALIFVGPGKLPEVGKALGKAVHNFKKASEGGQENEPTPPTPPPANNPPASPTSSEDKQSKT